MQYIIEIIRKIVILVLLMEVVLQLQSGKQYEPYIKMLIGIMVVYRLVSGIFDVWTKMETVVLAPMQEFQWTGNWYAAFEKQAQDQVEETGEKGSVWGKASEESNVIVESINVQVEIESIANISIEEISAGS